jgi:hypothetical protein
LRQFPTQPVATPAAVVPEAPEHLSTPIPPSPFVSVTQSVKVPWTPLLKTPRAKQLRDFDQLVSLVTTPLTKSSPKSDHIVPDMTVTSPAAQEALPSPPSWSDDLLDFIDRRESQLVLTCRGRVVELFTDDNDIFL